MPRKCSVCARADRELIEAALNNGGSFREIGRRFGLALGTIHRHMQHARRAAQTGAIGERVETEHRPEPLPHYTAADCLAGPLGVLAACQRWLFEARRRAGAP